MGGFRVHSHIYNISEIVTSSLPKWAAAHPHHPRDFSFFEHDDDSRVLHFKKILMFYHREPTTYLSRHT